MHLLSSKLKNIFILAAGFCFVSFFAATFYFLHQAPVLGIHASWDEKARAWVIDSEVPPAPFETGDVLYSLGDRRISFHDWLTDNIHIAGRKDLFAWFDAKKEIFNRLDKPRVAVGLLRDGQLIQVQAIVHRAGFSFLKKIEALHLIVGAAFFIIGLIVFRKKGFEEVGVVFFLFCLAMTLTFLTNAASMMCEVVCRPAYFRLMNLLNVPNPVVIAAFMLHFSLLMPEKRDLLIRFRGLLWLLYAVCAAVALTLSIGIMNVLFPLLFLASLLALGQGYVRYRNPVLRRQLLWIVYGFGLGLLPFVLVNGIPLMLSGPRLMNDTVPGLFLICIPLCMAFAIQKHKLMEIDTLFDNILIYAATFGVLTAMDVSVVGLYSLLVPDRNTAQGLVAGIVGLWLVIVAYVPVRNRFRVGVRRLLKREQYDLNDVLTRLSARLIRSVDTASICRATLAAIDESLHPLGGCVFLHARGSMTPATPAACVDVPPEWPAASREMRASEYLYRLFVADRLPPAYAAGVLVPMAGSSDVAGCIILKNKASGRAYSREDLSLLDMMARQASLAVDGIVAREAAALRERESREMKEHISREMHDGIGGSFSNAMMMLELLSGEFAGSAAKSRRISALRDTLTDGLAETRNLIRTMEESGASLSDMADGLAEKVRRLLNGSNIRYALETDIENHDLPLSPLTIHNMTKIVQEGIINALKHAQADAIAVAIREKGGTVTVTITDNGKGLAAPAQAGGGYGLRNMQLRCREIGADLQFSSPPGKGFEIAVSFFADPGVIRSG